MTRCDWRRCKRTAVVGYLGWHLCDAHFERVVSEETPQARQASAERGCAAVRAPKERR